MTLLRKLGVAVALLAGLAGGYVVGLLTVPRPQVLTITHLRTCEGVTVEEQREDKWLD